MATRIELLQRMPIFGGLREDSLEFLLRQAGTVELRGGEYFFRENDQANSMYVLESGRVAVCKTWHGRECLIRYLTTGDCFGEMALMDLFPRCASVRALEPCVAIELTPGNLYRLFEHDTAQFALIQMNMGREVCRRLRQSDEQLFGIGMGAEGPDTTQVFSTT